jgi:hypothetical protein
MINIDYSETLPLNKFTDDAFLVNLNMLKKSIESALEHGHSHLYLSEGTIQYVKIDERSTTKTNGKSGT